MYLDFDFLDSLNYFDALSSLKNLKKKCGWIQVLQSQSTYLMIDDLNVTYNDDSSLNNIDINTNFV